MEEKKDVLDVINYEFNLNTRYDCETIQELIILNRKIRELEKDIEMITETNIHNDNVFVKEYISKLLFHKSNLESDCERACRRFNRNYTRPRSN